MHMTDEVDDTTASELGHALLRWVIDEDPANVARFAPDLNASAVDDARAARLGHALADLLQGLDVA
jgi:hypothetical protein